MDDKPPPYDGPGAHQRPTDAKGDSSAAHAESPSTAPAAVQEDIVFHIYTSSKLFSQDITVTGPDKEIALYICDFSTGFLNYGAKLTLTRKSKAGDIVCFINRDITLGDATIMMPNGWHTDFVRTGIARNKRSFNSFDGQTKYQWRPDGVFKAGFTCYNTSNEEQIAAWRSTWKALTKDGVLTIKPKYAAEAELILATCIALEVHLRNDGT